MTQKAEPLPQAEPWLRLALFKASSSCAVGVKLEGEGGSGINPCKPHALPNSGLLSLPQAVPRKPQGGKPYGKRSATSGKKYPLLVTFLWLRHSFSPGFHWLRPLLVHGHLELFPSAPG